MTIRRYLLQGSEKRSQSGQNTVNNNGISGDPNGLRTRKEDDYER